MNTSAMKAFVIVATKGRPKETALLLDCLTEQNTRPEHVVVVGSEARDVENLSAHPQVIAGKVTVLVSGRAGTTIQRNLGLEYLTRQTAQEPDEPWFVVFFDDDFRPANDWLEKCAARLIASPEVSGLCGYVLADGVRCAGYDELAAREYLLGKRPPEAHWSHSAGVTDLPDGLYGCNMAYRDIVARTQRFDERLPLYGWQEDIDFAGGALKFGKLVCDAACRGVHMGVQGGRTSGLRFGYSQIANPIYLVRKGSMRAGFGTRLMCRNLASNLFNALRLNRRKDYFGRLRGNARALLDAWRGKLDPARILSM